LTHRRAWNGIVRTGDAYASVRLGSFEQEKVSPSMLQVIPLPDSAIRYWILSVFSLEKSTSPVTDPVVIFACQTVKSLPGSTAATWMLLPPLLKLCTKMFSKTILVLIISELSNASGIGSLTLMVMLLGCALVVAMNTCRMTLLLFVVSTLSLKLLGCRDFSVVVSEKSTVLTM
jgi:hypothetical protein